MPAQAISQVNIRMNSLVKDAGDRVLAEGGTTPTQIVRALWEKISHGLADLRQVQEVLGVATPDESLPSAEAEKLDTMQRGRALFAEGLTTWGISANDESIQDVPADVDLYTDALVERMSERGLW